MPLKLLCEKFAHTRFEPSGWSQNPSIGYAKSIMDYIFRWLELRFLTGEQGSLFDDLRPRINGAIRARRGARQSRVASRREAAAPGLDFGGKNRPPETFTPAMPSATSSSWAIRPPAPSAAPS